MADQQVADTQQGTRIAREAQKKLLIEAKSLITQAQSLFVQAQSLIAQAKKDKTVAGGFITFVNMLLIAAKYANFGAEEPHHPSHDSDGAGQDEVPNAKQSSVNGE